MHDKRIVADIDANRTGVQMTPWSRMNIAPKPDAMVAKAIRRCSRMAATPSIMKPIGQSRIPIPRTVGIQPNNRKIPCSIPYLERTTRLPANIENSDPGDTAGNVHARHKTAISLNQLYEGRFPPNQSTALASLGAMVAGDRYRSAYTSHGSFATNICQFSLAFDNDARSRIRESWANLARRELFVTGEQSHSVAR